MKGVQNPERMLEAKLMWAAGKTSLEIGEALGMAATAVQLMARRYRHDFPARRAHAGSAKWAHVKPRSLYLHAEAEAALKALQKRWKCSITDAINRALIEAAK